MTCRELTSFIADSLSGDLDAATKHSFERHLTLCPNCVQYVADYQRAIALGRQANDDADRPAVEVPEALVAAILAARRRSLASD